MSEPRPIYPKHFLREPVPRANTGFILMPFADEFEPVHEAIRAAIESAGLEPLRADDIFSTRAGMEKILRGIAEAEVVVADMSGQNANVFYEVGITHTHRENVILLMREDDDFPFDLQHIDHVTYAPTEDGLIELTTKLAEVIRGLPPERPSEAPQVQPVATHPTTPAELRRAVRRKLQDCERQWVEEVVPAQSRSFEEQFGEVLKSRRPESESREIIRESIKALQPAFLRPWEPIEELGFEVVEQGHLLERVLPDLIRALERAYSLPDLVRSRQHSTVVGHGQLLALRTWTLWGAYALDCQNWSVVESLLHQPVRFGHERKALKEHGHFHFPDAAGLREGAGYSDLAAESIYDQTGQVAQDRFGDLKTLQVSAGLWLFAAGLAQRQATAGRDLAFPLPPTWDLAPKLRLEELFEQLGTDAPYAANFSRAVAQVDTATLNKTWLSDIIELVDVSVRGGSLRPLPQFPYRLAE